MYKGEVKFFDDIKNNFGYITNIVSEEGKYYKDIYFSGDDVASNQSSLYEGIEVVFDIVQNNGRKKAINVKLFQSLPIEEKQNYIFHFKDDELQNFALSLLKSKANFTTKQKSYICKNVLSSPQTHFPFNSWTIIKAIGSEADKISFKRFLKTQSDDLKLYLIGDDNSLLLDVEDSWNFENQKSTKKFLLKVIESKNALQNTQAFYDKFTKVNKSFDIETNVIFYSLLDNDQEIFSYFYSFDEIDLKTINSIIKLVKKYFLIPLQSNIFEILFGVFETNKITTDLLPKLRLLRVLIEEYSLKEYLKPLEINILNSEINSYEELYESTYWLKLIPENELITKHLSKSYQQLNPQLKDSSRLDLITFSEDIYLSTILNTWEGSEFYSNSKLLSIIMNDDKYLSYFSNIKSLIQRILSNMSNNPKEFGNDEFLRIFFQYIIKYNDKSSLIKFVSTNLFSCKEVFELFMERVSDEQYALLLKNIYLTSESKKVKSKIELLSFLTKTDYFPKETTFLDALQFINSFFQQLVIKRIAYFYHLKKISYKTVVNLLDALQLNDLSAMLLKVFIVTKPSSKEEALKLLSKTFQEHLYLINQIDELNDSFEKLFKINSIVKLCDGRKYYDKRFWENGNLKRYYVNKNDLSIGEKIEKFCEGRFWKKEELFDSISNKPFIADLFWCRGDICYGLNDTTDLKLNSINWTLNEISQAFSFNLDPLIKSYIAGWANRMNEIVERLKCRECNSIMRPRPFDPTILGHYATPLFYCINNSCKNYEKDVRFTHCLNGKCNAILDSRDLKTCSNGWLICSYCKTCCPKHSGRDYYLKKVEH